MEFSRSSKYTNRNLVQKVRSSSHLIIISTSKSRSDAQNDKYLGLLAEASDDNDVRDYPSYISPLQ